MFSYIYIPPKRALFCMICNSNQTFPVSSCYSVSGSELPIELCKVQHNNRMHCKKGDGATNNIVIPSTHSNPPPPIAIITVLSN